MQRRLDFEREARRDHPDLQGTVIKRGQGDESEVVYRLDVPVPEYGSRRVTIRFYNSFGPILKSVFADGPTDSLHRYSQTQLCLWWADAPDNLKWTPDDGLAVLIRIIARHLFQEAWAREEGEWAGLERPHRRSAAPRTETAA